MEFIKNNYKKFISVLAILLIVLLFIYLIVREVSYSVEYDVDGYHIVEKYEKGSGIFTFNVSNNDTKYDFSIGRKYSISRKYIKEIVSFDRDEYKCVGIKGKNIESNVVCNKDNDYYDNIITKENNNDVKKTNDIVTIYNDSNDYYVWNGYGFTNLIDDSKYNFLNNESYTNDLSYQFGDYILVADYDQKREFDKFYIFNLKKKTIDEWKIKANITYDSYYMGNIGEDLYLFDCTTKTQYRMNIKKKRIKVVSKKDKGVFFDKSITDISINKLYYNKLLFNHDKLYNYNITEGKLYYKSHSSDINVRVSDLDILNIVGEIDNDIYYLSSNKLYKFNPFNGEELLVESFEWNFDYKNKIFVFPR